MFINQGFPNDDSLRMVGLAGLTENPIIHYGYKLRVNKLWKSRRESRQNAVCLLDCLLFQLIDHLDGAADIVGWGQSLQTNFLFLGKFQTIDKGFHAFRINAFTARQLF